MPTLPLPVLTATLLVVALIPVLVPARTLWTRGGGSRGWALMPDNLQENSDLRRPECRAGLHQYLRWKLARGEARGHLEPGSGADHALALGHDDGRLRRGALEEGMGPSPRWQSRVDHLSADLNLRVGDCVWVRSVDEILSTLDQEGCLDSLPFMPEMVDYCGRKFRVAKRFDKYNDYVYQTGLRRMKNAVLLEGVRCNGTSHGGCQALCQIIWKEAWLTRVEKASPRPSPAARPGHVACSRDDLLRATRGADSGDEPRFLCQATQAYKASSRLRWWDMRQYWRDLSSGNVSAPGLIRGFAFVLFSFVLRVGGYRLLVGLYNHVQSIRGGDPYPYRQGTLKRTPTRELYLKPGELVRVKSYDDILRTLDTNNKNRGLWFDAEMVKYCGGTYAALCRVETIVDNKSGRLIKPRNPCIVLEGVTNQGDYHGFSPRNEYLFWREVWLERVPGGPGGDSSSKVLPRA